MNEYGNGSGENVLYAIEARASYPEPVACNGMILTKEWRRVPVRIVSAGCLVDVSGAEMAATPHVPSDRWETPHARLAGLIDRPQAKLLAQRFQMQADGRVALCVETRLVAVKLKYSYSTEELGVGEPFSLFENTRSLEPVKTRENNVKDDK